RGLDWPCPLVADESCQGLDSLPGLVSIYDGVNIKLDKCGGVTEGLLMARQARRDGLMTMVGNMVGTSLSVAPAFLLAQVCDFADLDSTTFIERDLSPSVVIEDGWLRVPSGLWGNL
ncbi:MAG: enolase C-terminal domain-like protein, partial [Pseudomonadota bacterium]